MRRLALLAALCALAGRAGAQEQHDEHAAVDHAMSGGPDAALAATHLRMTPLRPATHADSVRALAVADTLRRALARYRDVRAAEADGYEMFAPQVRAQRVYHFTRKWSAVRNAFGFDPARPTSLLYRRDSAGGLVLVGAMYTASRRTPVEALDARVPLSLARWHEHVDICVPGRGERERWAERRNGAPLFGPAGSITTKAECDAAGGRFFAHLFGWMVHANVFAGDDPGAVWGDDHATHAGDGASPAPVQHHH